jgi:hypothetical protein
VSHCPLPVPTSCELFAAGPLILRDDACSLASRRTISTPWRARRPQAPALAARRVCVTYRVASCADPRPVKTNKLCKICSSDRNASINRAGCPHAKVRSQLHSLRGSRLRVQAAAAKAQQTKAARKSVVTPAIVTPALSPIHEDEEPVRRSHFSEQAFSAQRRSSRVHQLALEDKTTMKSQTMKWATPHRAAGSRRCAPKSSRYPSLHIRLTEEPEPEEEAALQLAAMDEKKVAKVRRSQAERLVEAQGASLRHGLYDMLRCAQSMSVPHGRAVTTASALARYKKILARPTHTQVPAGTTPLARYKKILARPPDTQVLFRTPQSRLPTRTDHPTSPPHHLPPFPPSLRPTPTYSPSSERQSCHSIALTTSRSS